MNQCRSGNPYRRPVGNPTGNLGSGSCGNVGGTSCGSSGGLLGGQSGNTPCKPNKNCVQSGTQTPPVCCIPVPCPPCDSDSSVGGGTDEAICRINNINATCGCADNSLESLFPSFCDFPLAMAYVPWQQWRGLYNQRQAFHEGTLFEQLNLEFTGRRCK